MITGKTRITGVIGDPIEHTMSPVIHNSAYAQLGLDYVYLPFRVRREDLTRALEGMRALNFVGINVTIPHKEAVLPFLDEVAEEAELIGAVNTIHNVRGRLIGYNTDGKGFVRSLADAECDPAGKVVTILGTGGAARAVAVQLALEGAAQLYILGRNPGKAVAIKAAVQRGAPQCRVITGALDGVDLVEILRRSEVLVHATPVGMYPHSGAEPLVTRELLHRGLLVCDLVYNPPETRLLAEARAAGCKTLPGTGMLVHQGAIAFSLWTGREAPVELMEKILRERLGG